MVDEILYIQLSSLVFSFIVGYLGIKMLIPRLINSKITGIDMNKQEQPVIPEMGGLGVIIAFLLGIYFQIWFYQFFNFTELITTYILASLIAIAGISMLGIIDDLIGVSQRTKAILPFIFSLHLGAFVQSEMQLPFFGSVEFGVLMLFLVPLSLTCASNSVNMLEGFNGLSAGLGAIVCTFLIILSYYNSETYGLILLFPLLGALLSFLLFNKFPAKVFLVIL